MKRPGTSRRIISAVVVVALLLAIAADTFFPDSGATTHAAAPGNAIPHWVTVKPRYLMAGTANGSNPRFSCQTPGAPVRCYGPKQIRAAYDIQRVLDAGDEGQGSTIVIIDAFQSPTIQHDVDLFSKIFGLLPTKVHIIAPNGLTPFNPNDPTQVGWAGEITLDVEWAHAIAPAATIDLVLAPSNQDADLLSVTQYAITHHLGTVISQSFGEAESCADPHLLAQERALFAQAVKEGITIFASSGDQGAAQPTCDGSSYFLSASTPASDPNVTAVGGTYLNADPQTGKYYGESAWNDQFGASGGGFSSIYARPSYQTGFIHNSQRGVPDVAYDGDVNGGVLSVWSSSGAGQDLVFIFGGTSAGSPQWAAMLALVNTMYGPQGNINPVLYKFFSRFGSGLFFHDITVGDNTFTGVGSNGQPVTIEGYNTIPRWDAVTGLGSLDLGNSILGPAATVPWTHH
jgi:subtilase family serine protease